MGMRMGGGRPEERQTQRMEMMLVRLVPRHLEKWVREQSEILNIKIYEQTAVPFDGEIIPQAMTRERFEETVNRWPHVLEYWGEFPPEIWQEEIGPDGKKVLFVPGDIESPPTNLFIAEEDFKFLLARESSILDRSKSKAEVLPLFPQRQIAAA